MTGLPAPSGWNRRQKTGKTGSDYSLLDSGIRDGRARNQPSPHRVERHITRRRDQVRVVERQRGKTSLKQMPGPARPGIDEAGVAAVRLGSRDAELLAPEFRPMDDGTLADQGPFTAWLRRGTGRDRVTAEPKLFEPLGTGEMIRELSRKRFGRPRRAIEERRRRAA